MKNFMRCANGHPMTENDATCPVCGTVPSTGDHFAPPPAILPSLEGYEVVEVLGQGGMGIVYKARHLQLDRWVALKMIRNWALAGPDELARFRAEAQAIAQLQHPHIVQIFEIGIWQGMPFLSLEFIAGGSLAAKISGKPFPPAEAARLTRTLAEAVAFAHAKGIVHRDLKPANILLTRNGEPKIGDFGLAKRMNAAPGLTQPDALLGTPCYMAPEQAQRLNEGVGPAADVYALGVILYELLTGRPPFVAENALQTIKQAIEQEPIPPRRVQPSVPRDLETICLKCLRKSPKQRYPSAKEFADDLEAFNSGMPIKARPVRRTERMWRWCRRNPLPAVLGMLLLVVFLAGFGLVAWKWLEAEDHLVKRNDALQAQTIATKKASDAAERERAAGKRAEEASQARLQLLEEKQKAFLELQEKTYLLAANTASRFGEDGNALLAEKLLFSIPPHLRGCDWDFLRNSQSGLQTAYFECGLNLRNCVRFSPDGKLLAQVDLARSVVVRDVHSGKEKARLSGHKGNVHAIAFSHDQNTLAVADDQGVMLWDWQATKPTSRRMEELSGKITALAASRDGKLALGWDGGFAVRTFAEPHKQEKQLVWSSVRSDFANLDWSRNGRYLATGQRDGTVRFVDVGRPIETLPLVQAHRTTCWAVAFTPDNKSFVTSGVDGLVKVWSLETRNLVRVFEGNSGPIACLSVDATGRRLAAGTFGFAIRLWDMEEGTTWNLLRGHLAIVDSVAFAPTGLTLASSSFDGSVRVWDPNALAGCAGVHVHREGSVAYADSPDANAIFLAQTSPSKLWRVDLHGSDPLKTKTETKIPLHRLRLGPLTLAADAGGRRIAVAEAPEPSSSRASIYVFDAATGLEERVFRTTTVQSLQFDPRNGQHLVSGHKDGSIRVWDLSGAKEPSVLAGFSKEAFSVQFTADGKWLAACGQDESKDDRSKYAIRFWDLKGQKAEPTLTLEIPRQVRVFAFSHDGKQLAYGVDRVENGTSTIEVIDWRASAPLERPLKRLEGHFHSVMALAFHPTGKHLLSTSGDGSLRLWNLSAGSEIIRHQVRDRFVNGSRIGFSRSGRYAISSALDSVHIWDGTCSHEQWILHGFRRSTTGVAFRPDGKRLIAGSWDGAVRAWNVESGEEATGNGFPQEKAHKGRVHSVAFAPSGQYFATGGSDKQAILWNASDAKEHRVLTGHDQSVHWVAFSNSSKLLATASNDKTCKVWEVAGGKELFALKGHEDVVNTVAFNHDDSLVASCSKDRTIRLWNPATGELVRALVGHDATVTDVAFDPQGKRIASGATDGRIFLWDAGAGEELCRFVGHENVLQSLAFHPKRSEVLISVGNDSRVRFWNVGNSKVKEIASLRGHLGDIYGLAISPDGRLLATTGTDRTVRTWSLDFLDRPNADPMVRYVPEKAAAIR